MGKLLGIILGFIGKNFFTFILIMTILIGAPSLIKLINLSNLADVEIELNLAKIQAKTKELRVLGEGLPDVKQEAIDKIDNDIEKLGIKIRGAWDTIIWCQMEFPIKSPIPGTVCNLKILEQRTKIAYFKTLQNALLITRGKIFENYNKSIKTLTKEIKELKSKTAKMQEEKTDSFHYWLTDQVGQQLILGITILISLVFTPVLIKAIFYFVFAPLASKFKAIQIITNSTTDDADYSGPLGSFSITPFEIKLIPSEELCLRGEYIPTSNPSMDLSFRFLLDRRIPFSCLSSGLYGLTRIVSDKTESILLSSDKHPLMRLAEVELKEGVSAVFFPRSLAGVITPIDGRVKITRHWRLGSLHGWLTLQLRYLVFHGPVRLIVKGFNGVRVENADEGKAINQMLTLGFSTNLKYKNTRSDPFVSYWMGERDLLDDHFHGQGGFVIYEEMPDPEHRNTGVFGRGLEGILDSILKVFGL